MRIDGMLSLYQILSRASPQGSDVGEKNGFRLEARVGTVGASVGNGTAKSDH